MLTALNDSLLAIGDLLLGWLLNLPTDAVLLIVAIGSSAVLTGVRLFTTNQDLLGRCDRDKKRQKVLLKQARRQFRRRKRELKVDIKAARDELRSATRALQRLQRAAQAGGDAPGEAAPDPVTAAVAPQADLPAARARCRRAERALRDRRADLKDARAEVLRHRATTAAIGMKCFRAEGKPFLAALLPIIIIAVWCLQRMEFHPPRPGRTVELAAYFPLAGVGHVAHIVPQEGVQAVGGWVREVGFDPDGMRNGLAVWTLKAAARDTPYVLKLRHRGRTYERPLTVGGRTYSAWYLAVDDGVLAGTQVRMEQVKLFGLVPGVLGLPPWLVAYLLIVVPFYFVLKRVWRVY